MTSQFSTDLIARMVAESTKASGVPPHLEDEGALEKIAELLDRDDATDESAA